MVLALSLPATRSHAAQPKELVFGMSAAFTGANGELGIEFYRGVMAYVKHFNANVGPNDWKIRIVPANDGYNPTPCFNNTVKFIETDNVFALFSYVGTPTTTQVLPLLKKFDNRNMYLLFPFTGAHPLRSPPFGKYVYNLRASYFDETAGLIDHFLNNDMSRISVFYQNDAYGRTGWDGVRRALQKHDLEIVSEAAYTRGARFEQDFTDEVNHLMNKGPEAIICIGTYASQGAFIRDARNAGFEGPIAGVSFSDSDKMLELLTKAGKEKGENYVANLIHSQVVPSYEDLSLPGVRLYRKLMDEYKDLPLTTVEGYAPRRFSYVSFEGFLNGILLGEIVKRLGDMPNRERLPKVIESIRDFDLGIGVNADFGPNRHQALDSVYITTVIEGHFRRISRLGGFGQ